ncbi:MAG: class I SAM-dependent methyltransferase [Myxococcales bacterium]
MTMHDSTDAGYAESTRSLLAALMAGYPAADFAVRLWDGSCWFPREGQEPERSDRRFTLVLTHPGSLRSMFVQPSMLNFGEAFLAGDFDIEGDILAACGLGDYLMRLPLSFFDKLKLAARIRRLPATSRAATGRGRAPRRGRIGSRERLRAAIAYHYDLPVSFWKLWLDPTLAYSCAYFEDPADSLETAQMGKLDYVCRKLELSKGERFLDLGCGWGGLIMHAARRYGVRATGVTLSRCQAEYASGAIRDAGLQRQCEVQFLDFRDLPAEPVYDKVACVGAVEHVPEAQLVAFFEHAKRLLKPGGLFLNHGITGSLGQVHPPGRSFVDAYVFPDHGVTTVSRQLVAAEQAGFEVRDVECLREHYVRTAQEWLRRIERNAAELASHSSVGTQRLYRLYVAAQTYYFSTGASSLHQALFAKMGAREKDVPVTRAHWYRPRRERAVASLPDTPLQTG